MWGEGNWEGPFICKIRGTGSGKANPWRGETAFGANRKPVGLFGVIDTTVAEAANFLATSTAAAAALPHVDNAAALLSKLLNVNTAVRAPPLAGIMTAVAPPAAATLPLPASGASSVCPSRRAL